MLADTRSGDVLAASEQATAFPLASATKLMTYYVAADRLKPGREIVVAPYDAQPGESLAGFEAGDRISVRDALFGLMVPSGNDAARTLAIAVAGSESDFVALMNAAARDLGLGETTFDDSIGLDADNVSSARDLVALARELQKDRLFRKIVDTERVTLRSGSEPLRVRNRNPLLFDKPFVDGIKTGTTLVAGYVLVGSGTRKGVGLTSVVLGSPSEGARDSATLDLLDYGFSLYGRRALVKEGDRLGSVPLAAGGRLEVVAGEELRVVSRRDQQVKVSLATSAPVEPPLAKGARVTSATVRLDGRRVGTIDALAARSVAGLPASRSEGESVPSWVWFAFGGAVFASLLLGGLAVRASRSG